MKLTDVDIHAIGEDCHYENHMGCYAFNALGLRKFTAKAIAANNAKVLADLKPVAEVEEVSYLGINSPPGKIISSRGEIRVGMLMYSAETVSALIQERDALAARVEELEAQSKQAIKDALEEAAIAAWDAFGNDEARHAIRKLKDQL